MKPLTMRALTAGAITAALVLALVATSASAQYPSPEEPITVELSDPTPEVGETITLNIVVQNPDAASELSQGPRLVLAGGPLSAPSAAGSALQQGPPFSCTAGVSGGEGAEVSPEDFETDSDGRASLELYTGTQPATLTVSIVCGELSTQVVVPVGGADDGAGTDPDTGEVPGPPDTGMGSTSGSESFSPFWVIAGGLAAAGGAIGLGVVARSRSGRDRAGN